MKDHNHTVGPVTFDWSGLTSVAVCSECGWRTLTFSFHRAQAAVYAHVRGHSVCGAPDCQEQQAPGMTGLCRRHYRNAA